MENNFGIDLKNIENKIELIYKNKNIVVSRIKELEQFELVQEYKKLVSLNQNLYCELSSTEEKYISLKQEHCKHPIWLFIKEETDTYEGRMYYTCECLECNLEKEQRSKYFNNVIVGNYIEIKEEYRKNINPQNEKEMHMIKKYRKGNK